MLEKEYGVGEVETAKIADQAENQETRLAAIREGKNASSGTVAARVGTAAEAAVVIQPHRIAREVRTRARRACCTRRPLQANESSGSEIEAAAPLARSSEPDRAGKIHGEGLTENGQKDGDEKHAAPLVELVSPWPLAE